LPIHDPRTNEVPPIRQGASFFFDSGCRKRPAVLARPNFPVKQLRCALIWQIETADAGAENCNSINASMKYLKVIIIELLQFMREMLWRASARRKRIAIPNHDTAWEALFVLSRLGGPISTLPTNPAASL
jgi:hypothetical protein